MTQQKHSKPSSKNCIFQILLTIQIFAMFLLCFCFAAANSILFDGFCCKQLAKQLVFLSFFLWFLLQIACKNEEIQAICKLFATKTIKKYRISCCKAKTQQKHSKILNSQQNLKNAIFAGRFAMFLLCHCYVFALQQLILYFLMVVVANSLQIACKQLVFLHFFYGFCCKQLANMKKYKLFASYLQQKPSKSIGLVAAEQKHSKNIPKF